MTDPHEIARRLSALRTKILEKYTEGEIEALHDDLLDFEADRLGYALWSFSKDFPMQKILKKEKLENAYERANLYFQSIALKIAVAVFQSADGFFPGLSDYEIWEIVGQHIRYATDDLWPFSDLMEDPGVTRRKHRDAQKQGPGSTPQE